MITKTFAQDGLTCRVTFRLTAPVDSAALLGDFNRWNPDVHPLERDEDGTLGVTLALEPGDYRFRYLVDGLYWLNDAGADAVVPNLFGTADSVIAVRETPLAIPEVAAAPKPKTARPKAAAKRPAAKTASKPAAAPKSAKPPHPQVQKAHRLKGDSFPFLRISGFLNERRLRAAFVFPDLLRKSILWP